MEATGGSLSKARATRDTFCREVHKSLINIRLLEHISKNAQFELQNVATLVQVDVHMHILTGRLWSSPGPSGDKGSPRQTTASCGGSP